MLFRIILLLSFIQLMACSNNATTEEANASKSKEKLQEQSQAKMAKSIVFFGNSLSAAYGIDPQQGFVALIQKKIDSLGLNYKVVNAGLSGETTSGGKERIDWILEQKVDVFVLELGGNDGLRGIDPKLSYQNLQDMINKVKTKYPEAKIILAGMEAPPNMGADFTQAFRQMYPTLAKENKVALIPFILKDVGGIPELNQPDGIHPNIKGNKIIAETVWEVLKEQL